jgi:membrane dipeptidase
MKKLVLLLLLVSCAAVAQKKKLSDEELRKLADQIAHKYVLTDTHVDLPYRLKIKNFKLDREYMGIPVETKEGDFDYVRAKKGGLSAPFMSIYIPSNYQKTGREKALADSLIDMVQGIVKAHPDKFAEGRTPQQIDDNFKKGLVSLPMGMENGAPILQLSDVKYYYDKGIRYITLTHGKDNHICDSSYDSTYTWKGLSPYGKEVVKEMNRVGIMVDISHVSDDSFYQAIELSRVPCIASHSSCRYYTPGFKRNMSDEMIKALAKKGGVIQINFGTSFLDEKARLDIGEKQKKLQGMLREKGLKMSDEAAKPILEQFQKDNPILFADVEKVADHIEHVIKLAGVDYVGIGSDYDGVGDTLPTGLKDVSQYPNLIYVLLKRGYTEKDIAKIMSQNLWRVWKKVQAGAEKS